MTLQDLRLDLGKTQAEMAADLKLGATTISLWECGEIVPRPGNLKKLATYFGKTPAEIRKAFTAKPEAFPA